MWSACKNWEAHLSVGSFVAVGRKQMRVLCTTTYGVPPMEEGNGGDGDGVLSGEEEHPTTQAAATRNTPQPASTPARKERQTAAVVEAEKAKLAQANKMNSVPESMERWRCTIPHCHL